MTTDTTTVPAGRHPAGTTAAPLQMGELVLRTGRFDQMCRWYGHLLGRGPFFERTPDPAAPPRPAGMPERAVDVRLAFFTVHEGGHPHHQVLGLFGIDGLAGAQSAGPGLHHFQFGVGSIAELVAQYEHMGTIEAVPHRAANHGQATSFYFRDPDGNVIEFSCSNFATLEEELGFMASPQFAANPSGLELDPEKFAARFHTGDPALLDLDNRAVAR